MSIGKRHSDILLGECNWCNSFIGEPVEIEKIHAFYTNEQKYV